ncbi:hypothetical protein ACHAXA_001702 [Cyclostephanos tholiformis]|uniref:DNA topoisomerase 2 n=1 Tax=Cyclostephanos tholiformis TaxID=382380 RepID=A0ABD3R3S7_9STRA
MVTFVVRQSRRTYSTLLLLRRASHHRLDRHIILPPTGSITHDVIIIESRTRPIPLFSYAPSRLFSSTAQDDDGADLSLEETYTRKTPLEHILLRPAMYIGSTERLPPAPCWVLKADSSSPQETDVSADTATSIPWAMRRENLPLVPALLKVFDEILVNASDNHVRHPGSCDRIDVVIHRGGDASTSMRPYISIANNGRSIPVQVHEKENMYVPELLFGHLLTGSNFNDDQRTLTGGRHGYGAKLTNVFSKEFVVEIRDGTRGKVRTYKQVWEDNMRVCHEAEIDVETKKSMHGDKTDQYDYTKISFVPDLARLTNDPNTTILPEEEYKLMRRRVVDIAGCSGGKLAVTLNGEPINVSGFEEYVSLFRRQPSPSESTVETSSLPPPIVYCKLNSRWEIAVGRSETRSLESMSFVNRMQTSRNGTHVDLMARQISQFIADHINSKMPQEGDTLVTPRAVRRHLLIFVNCLVENPSFDSQMKDCLTSNPESFGCNYTLPSSFMRKLVKPLKIFNKTDKDDSENYFKDDVKLSDELGGPGIVEDILHCIMGARQIKDDKLLKEVGAPGKQTKRQVLAIPKLDDANLAGGKMSSNCTLILTEGDSAKALAVAGLEIIGRDKYGVFPLRGKFLNVRSVSVEQLANNAELKSICTILGLQFDKSYETWEERNELRYGHVMLMTDQDADGSHIKGLIINLFRHFWPALLRPPVANPKSEKIESGSFLSMFVTPLLKASKRGTKKESLSFFSMAEYHAWRDMQKDDIHKWKVKYYKGLGTSTSIEAKEYFLDFVRHHRPFRWQSEVNDGRRIDMAFGKDRAEDRKDWILTTYDENSMLKVEANDDNSVTYGDFVDKELIHFSNANNIRAFPSVVDGLKPSQRKVLYACFKRNLKDEIKVAQLAGFCAEHTAYHHGEASLHSTIVGMAQNFVGSNNINLLIPSGQFGTRLMGGRDAASPRYIFTHLSPIARLLFPEVDDTLLTYKEEEGHLIEPHFYCPVIPLLLINGCQGIGTGWSTNIPQHNPRDVLNYIRAKLNGNMELPTIKPWVRDFQGDITADIERGCYISKGRITVTSNSSVSITELPVGVWTNDYRNSLLKMMSKAEIMSFTENHTTSTVSFDIKINISKLQRYLQVDIHNIFKLQNSLSTRNMHAFTDDMRIVRYNTPQEIADSFFPIRLKLYGDRKLLLECNMEYLATVMRNKSMFIEAVSTDRVNLLGGRKSKEATIALLEEMGFSKHSELNAIKTKYSAVNRPRAAESDDKGSHDSPTEFDYLLSMPLSSLTMEKLEALNEEAQKAEAKLNEIRNSSKEDLWNADLDKLMSLTFDHQCNTHE